MNPCNPHPAPCFINTHSMNLFNLCVFGKLVEETEGSFGVVFTYVACALGEEGGGAPGSSRPGLGPAHAGRRARRASQPRSKRPAEAPRRSSRGPGVQVGRLGSRPAHLWHSRAALVQERVRAARCRRSCRPLALTLPWPAPPRRRARPLQAPPPSPCSRSPPSCAAPCPSASAPRGPTSGSSPSPCWRASPGTRGGWSRRLSSGGLSCGRCAGGRRRRPLIPHPISGRVEIRSAFSGGVVAPPPLTALDPKPGPANPHSSPPPTAPDPCTNLNQPQSTLGPPPHRSSRRQRPRSPAGWSSAASRWATSRT